MVVAEGHLAEAAWAVDSVAAVSAAGLSEGAAMAVDSAADTAGSAVDMAATGDMAVMAEASVAALVSDSDSAMVGRGIGLVTLMDTRTLMDIPTRTVIRVTTDILVITMMADSTQTGRLLLIRRLLVPTAAR